jgi:hypothetical protein
MQRISLKRNIVILTLPVTIVSLIGESRLQNFYLLFNLQVSTSSTTAASPGIGLSINLGASCQSVCANGRMGTDQCMLV